MRISFMRWRPGSDGREPRERRKWLEINGVPSRARFRMFIRNRLWIGLPPLSWQGLESYCCCWFPAENRLRSGAWCGRRSPAVYAYSVGYWASGLQRDPIRSRWPKTRNRLPGIGLLPASCMVAVDSLRWGCDMLCRLFSEYRRIVEGERTVLEGAAEIVSKY